MTDKVESKIYKALEKCLFPSHVNFHYMTQGSNMSVTFFHNLHNMT